jgi:hypothetical protein
MKLPHLILGVSLLLLAGDLFGQTNQARLFIPFFDRDSQSNVVVAFCNLGRGERCPLEYTNVLSNTNLFTQMEQKEISEVFVKYKNITTNFGPSGTLLVNLYKTNYTVQAIDKAVNIENYIACFQHTNSDAREEVIFGGGVLIRVRNKANDGYNVTFNCTGGGTLLNFWEVKQNLINGLFIGFDDNRPQGVTWDYKLANFDGSHLEEYRRYTNGMVFGKFLMWNTQNGNLMLEADFKEPYSFDKHRTDLQTFQQHTR